CSGLAAWRPFFRDIERTEKEGRLAFLGSPAARGYIYQQIEREKPECEVGTKSVYSDLGFMLLGAAVELLTGTTLDRFCHERIFRPLGLRSTSFVDLTELRARRVGPITAVIA